MCANGQMNLQHELTVEEKNTVSKLLNEDFTHADVRKYVGVK